LQKPSSQKLSSRKLSSQKLSSQKPSKALKSPTESSTSIQKAPTSETKINEDAIQSLCEEIGALDIQTIEDIESSQSEQESNSITKNAKKKAKAQEIARLKKLPFEDIVKMIPYIKDVIFEPFSPGHLRDPEINIPSNIDTSDPLALLDLFIPPEMYATIAENTNLYAIAQNAPTAPTSTNKRYWWPTNANKIRVLYGIFYYMGVHQESNYEIYWENQ